MVVYEGRLRYHHQVKLPAIYVRGSRSVWGPMLKVSDNVQGMAQKHTALTTHA